jgi:hypothetical protein
VPIGHTQSELASWPWSSAARWRCRPSAGRATGLRPVRQGVVGVRPAGSLGWLSCDGFVGIHNSRVSDDVALNQSELAAAHALSFRVFPALNQGVGSRIFLSRLGSRLVKPRRRRIFKKRITDPSKESGVTLRFIRPPQFPKGDLLAPTKSLRPF